MADLESLLNQIEDIPLDLQDKRDLILVKYGLKPAASLSLVPKYKEGQKGHISFLNEFVEKIKEILGNLGLEKKVEPARYSDKWRDKKLIQEVYAIQIDVGKNRKNLDKLLSARDNIETGKAYGYPKTATRYYHSLFNHDIGDREAWSRYWQKLKEVSPEKTPEELAFISYCPSFTKKGNFNQNELKNAKKYADFFRNNFPDLYQKIVDDFKRKMETKSADYLQK
jgi:hypothetical protein